MYLEQQLENAKSKRAKEEQKKIAQLGNEVSHHYYYTIPLFVIIPYHYSPQ